MRRLSALSISPRLANRCTLRAAELAAILGQYDQAISKFETVAFASIDDTLLSWSVKEYFLQAALCHICTKVWLLILDIDNLNFRNVNIRFFANRIM